MGLREQLENMSPREQKLLTALGGIFAAFIFLGLPLNVYSDVANAREHNEEITQLLGRMNKASELLALRKGEREARERQYTKPAPALASFIEKTAETQGIDIPESSDRPELPGEGFVERSTVVKMRKVNLKPLITMLEKIERSGHPVAVTRLSVKTRPSGPDLYDVQLAVSAYDKKGKNKKDASKKKGASKKRGASKKGSEL
jgi:general secretion pathway protein M